METKVKKSKWYEIVRTDGTVQYAAKYEGIKGYFLWGSGAPVRCFKKLKSLREVDEVPTKYSLGEVYFDDGTTETFRALIDENNWWNGWAMPWIHHSEMKRFCEHMSHDEEYYTLKMKDRNAVLHHVEEKGSEYEFETIEPSEINGEKFYYFGNCGWTFEFKEIENDKRN